jgi:hypothetical protein
MSEGPTFFCTQCWKPVAEHDRRCPACGADLADRPPYFEGLQRALHCPEPTTARRAAFLLGLLRDPAAVPALVQVLRDSDDPVLAGEAATALARLPGAAAQAALRAAASHRFVTVRAAARSG